MFSAAWSKTIRRSSRSVALPQAAFMLECGAYGCIDHEKRLPATAFKKVEEAPRSMLTLERCDVFNMR